MILLLGFEKQRIAVAAVVGDMASGGPTSLAWIMASHLVCVALTTKTPGRRVQHLGVVGPVRLVALLAATAGESSHRIMFVDEGSSLVAVTGHALALHRVAVYL